MDQIEQCVTELVGRLRDCEVERCGLQSQLTASGQEVRRLREACQQINVLQTTVKRLEDVLLADCFMLFYALWMLRLVVSLRM